MQKSPVACRAVLYLRLSRDDDNPGESESIQNQRSLLQAYAEREGFPIVGEYADDGWSGTRFDRPRFQDMLRDMEQQRFEVVLVKDDCVNIELNSEGLENTGFCKVSSVF